jgi:hypothetical protein
MIPSFLLVILFSTFRNTKAFTVGGLRGLEFALTTPVFALGIFGFGSAILRSEHTSHSSASALIGLLAVPSRLILSTLGLFALVYVARRAVHGELLPQFMKGAHPEHSVRNYWFARELEAKSTHRDVLISGRKRLSKIIGRDRIADFLVVIASQLGSIVAMQSMYSKSDLTEFFRGSFLLSFACIFSTCCVVLRRLYLPPRPGLPVVSGDLRGSLRRWYTPIACAQIVAAAIPVILAGVDFVDIGEYVISVFTGMLLGYVMLLSLIPRATRRATMRATARVICALVVTVFVTGYADFWILGEVKRGSYHMFPGEAPTGPDLFYYTGFVLRAFAWFFAIALVMDLRGLLLQRIHESEVLNHPIGALSTDPLPSAPTPPA